MEYAFQLYKSDNSINKKVKVIYYTINSEKATEKISIHNLILYKKTIKLLKSIMIPSLTYKNKFKFIKFDLLYF
jgi:hypothetical protein